jgi:hypothetical protein
MNMNEYSHHVSGFFAHREEAQGALARLVERGLARERLQIFAAEDAAPATGAQADSNKVLKDVLVDGAIGTAVGTGLGALGELALIAANVTLFVASPLLAPLMMLGWGASIGAVVGAATGATATSAADGEKKDGRLADLIHDAILNGQFVLVAGTRTVEETAIAREVIEAAVGEYEDVVAA